MIILQDTREQKPWDFTKYGYDQRVGTVKTGDYTVEGYEDFLVCERKASTNELSLNVGSKWKVFSKELVRMQAVPYRYIICEFPLSHIYNFPAYSSIPKKNWRQLRVTADFLSKRVEEITDNYNIPIIFAGDRITAEQRFIEIINETINNKNNT